MRVKVLKKRITTDIIEQIIEIDKKFYLNFDYDREKSWYYQRYLDKNKIFCLYVNDKIVGYFLFYKISKTLFYDILNLKYGGDYNFPLSEINVKSNYYYMPSVIVAKEYQQYSFLLLRKLISEAYLKKHLVVITVSEKGRCLAKNRLQFIGNVNKSKNINIYAKI